MGRGAARSVRRTGSVAVMRTPKLAAALVSVGLVIGVSACGGDNDATTTPTEVADLDLEPIDESDLPDQPASPDKPDVDVPDQIPTELVTTDLITGSGHAAETGDSVVVDYVGVRSEDGAEFDNSFDRGVPFNVRLGEGRVIQGWDEGLVGVQTGTRRQIDIPAELAYGDNPPGGSVIQAGDALTFVVDVRAVIASVTPDDAPEVDLEPSVGRDGLDTEDVVVGEGPELEDGQTAIAHLVLYRGEDLEVLESTWNFDDPAQIVLAEGNAIDGLVQGLVGMRVGGVRIISIPPELAFGEEGIPDAGVPANADVIIVVELLGAY